MKANNTTIENALHLAFSPEYINALSLVKLAETWSDNHNARDLDLNIEAYAEQCTYKMEQEGATLEFDAWERLTAEIERGARCNNRIKFDSCQTPPNRIPRTAARI